jgi:hypothetical protein
LRFRQADGNSKPLTLGYDVFLDTNEIFSAPRVFPSLIKAREIAALGALLAVKSKYVSRKTLESVIARCTAPAIESTPDQDHHSQLLPFCNKYKISISKVEKQEYSGGAFKAKFLFEGFQIWGTALSKKEARSKGACNMLKFLSVLLEHDQTRDDVFHGLDNPYNNLLELCQQSGLTVPCISASRCLDGTKMKGLLNFPEHKGNPYVTCCKIKGASFKLSLPIAAYFPSRLEQQIQKIACKICVFFLAIEANGNDAKECHVSESTTGFFKQLLEASSTA